MTDFVTGHVAISREGIFLNGRPFFPNTEEGTKAFFKAAYRFLEMDYPKFHKMDGLCQLGLLATEVLVRHFKLQERYGDDEIALVFSNASSSLDSDVQHWAHVEGGTASPAVFVYTLPNIVMGEIAIKHKWFGESVFFVAPEMNPAVFAGNAALMMQGRTKACILAWVDFLGDDWSAKFFMVEKAGELPLKAENLESI